MEDEILNDWLMVPCEEFVIETEFEYEFLQKCEKIKLKKAVADKQFLKDVKKIKQGYYKITTRCREKLSELGYEI